jgi:uncharacterized protein YeaO (DUF488 family)
MAVRIVRLGSDRVEGEGLRIGTVRRPPRGVPKADFGPKNWYDVWLPNLSPSAETVRLGKRATTDREWRAFEKQFRAEMKTSQNARLLELLAALSHQANFSVGCYCQDETRCHRAVLRKLLREKGADMV